MSASSTLRDIISSEHCLQIEFKQEWENGTGYLDGLVDAQLPPLNGASLYYTVDRYERTVLIMPTKIGNIVAFDRYGRGDKGVVVGNSPRLAKPVLPSGAWSADAVENVFAYPYRIPKGIDNLLSNQLKDLE